MNKIFFIILITIFLYACANNQQIIKYKTYKFNEYIQLETLKFKPFKNYDSFKAKIIFTLKNGKNYSFYALAYKDSNSARIFCYTFFGKQVIDILFDVKNYVVLGGKPEMYLICPNKVDEKESLFYFLKEVIYGVTLNNAKILNRCITGSYNNYKVVSCEDSNYKDVYFYNKDGILEREFNISDNEITLKLNGNILKVYFKEKINNKDF
jgi:hypothetical protein